MSSYKAILRSTILMGGSSVANVIINVVKVKALALLVGPSGVGLLGIYQNFVGTTQTLAGLGVNNSGVRQLAAAADEAVDPRLVRLVLLGYNLVAGFVAAACIAGARDLVATWAFGDTTHAAAVGWLGVGAFLTLVAGSQAAVLQGRRKIRELAIMRMLSALLGAAIGVTAVAMFGVHGIVPFVIAAPATKAVVAYTFNRRDEALRGSPGLAGWQHQLWAMLRLGVPFMGAALMTAATQLYSRVLVVDQLGLDAGGHFQAAWQVSTTYIGVVLAAMAADYYPRLTQSINEPETAGRLVNEQTEVALLLGGPVLVGMMGFAPLVVVALYSTEFLASVEVLRWQVFGDLMKLMSWPLGFVLIAQGRGTLYLFTQGSWNGVYLLALWFGLDAVGLEAAGYGFALAYACVFVLNLAIVRRILGYRMQWGNAAGAALLMVAAGGVLAATLAGPWVAYGVATVATLSVSAASAARLDQLFDWRTKLRKRLRREPR